MRGNCCRCEIRKCLAECMLNTRKELSLSQMEFAEKLNMDRRSYLELEHGNSLCCTITLLIYLVYYCKDPIELLRSCRGIFEKYKYNELH